MILAALYREKGGKKWKKERKKDQLESPLFNNQWKTEAWNSMTIQQAMRVILEVHPSSIKPWDDRSPDQHLDCILMWHPESEDSAKPYSDSWLTETVRKNKCLLF